MRLEIRGSFISLQIFTFDMRYGTKNPPGPHFHSVDLSESEIKQLKEGETIKVLTSETAGHEHELEIAYRKTRKNVEFCK